MSSNAHTPSSIQPAEAEQLFTSVTSSTDNSKNGLGTTALVRGEYDKALIFYERSLKINEKLGHKPGISFALASLGTVYSFLKEYDKAIYFYEESLKIDRDLGHVSGVATNLSNIGEIYFFKTNHELAIDYLMQSLEHLEKMRKTALGTLRRDFMDRQIYTYQMLAQSYIGNKQPVEALKAVEIIQARFLNEQLRASNH